MRTACVGHRPAILEITDLFQGIFNADPITGSSDYCASLADMLARNDTS